MNPFASLGLSAPLVRAVTDLGFEEPTPIQRETIPAILGGRDLRASAQTGSGKTAAFVLPILEMLAADRGRARVVRALVLVPTRELAAQIVDVIAACARHLPSPPKTCLAVGGVSINPQMMALRGGADIVVATPGRLLDLVDHNALRLASVETLVLDEADRLLSLGFADELARVLALLERRQSLLFSATFPPAVRSLADEVLEDPLFVDVDAGVSLGDTGALIVQRVIEVDAPRRTMLLRHLVATHGWSRVLVFVGSRYAAEHVADKLTRAAKRTPSDLTKGVESVESARITAVALHGQLSQGARSQALADFKAKRVRVLVATDLAARGIDIAELPAVVNYDLPRSAVDYLHRIGRTGRAGESGVAVSFVSADTDAHFRLIEKRHDLHLERERIPGFEPTILEPTMPVRDPHGGVKGKRKSKKDKLREAAARKT
ncbi:MAG: ATP-dependent helicase RhlE [Myxococcales bacterium]|jgi:superfamily II DNA/RNA helicase|nr:ATP-dependent helicase RhlE [Myxococcales bacterium]